MNLQNNAPPEGGAATTPLAGHMAPDIAFYHVTEPELWQAVCRLLEKIYGMGLRVLVLLEDAESLQRLDALLWQHGRGSFLPHGTEGDPFPEQQPLFLSCYAPSYVPNDATVLLSIGRASLPPALPFQRLVHFLYGELAIRQSMYHALLSQYHAAGQSRIDTALHWVQTPQGSWQKTTPPVTSPEKIHG